MTTKDFVQVVSPILVGISSALLILFTAKSSVTASLILGAVIAIALLIALLIYAHKQGWLKRAVSWLFPQTDSQAIVAEFYEAVNSITEMMESEATTYGDHEKMFRAFDNLIAHDARAKREEVAAMSVRLRAAHDKFQTAILRSVSKSQQLNEGVTPVSQPAPSDSKESASGQSTQAKVSTPKATTTTVEPLATPESLGFAPNIYYSVVAANGQPSTITGQQIAELVNQGYQLGRDFLVNGPVATNPPRPSSGPGNGYW